MSSDSRIRILTFNCWGLKFIAKNLEIRIEAIAQALADTEVDIITLQEIWVFAHYEKIQASVAARLPHAKFYYGGALGAGLAVLSRYPILQTGIHPYSLNGEPMDVAAGDWFVGKAAASAVILHPLLGKVSIFNTHLFAKGGEFGPEWQRAHRLVNAWELAKLARQAAEAGNYVILNGDLNSIPGTLPTTILFEHASLTDAWEVTHPGIDPNTITTAQEAVDKLGITADSPVNTWSAGKSYVEGFGKRLDYCLYRQPIRYAAPSAGPLPVLNAIESKVVFTEYVPNQTYSYSDHFGLETTLEIIQAPPSDVSTTTPAPLPAIIPPQRELSNATIATTIQALTERYRMAGQRSRRELIIFILSLVVLVGVAVGTAWLPHAWINPIFIVFTIFMSWLATTMLYEGFIFGNWEQRALLNVIEELEVWRKGQDILSGRVSA